MWADFNDPRITRFGRFLRRSHLDELPQLFSVLKGTMSMVGPRPERPIFVKELTDAIPFYEQRHRVKPGVTGWAQLCYPYGASTADAKEKLQAWRRDYNESRPHRSLNNLSPLQYKAQWAERRSETC